MSEEIRLQRNPELIATELDGETVMMDVDSGNYFSLNQVGSAVWRSLEIPVTRRIIVEKVLHTFDSSEQDNVASDVSNFLDELLQNGLIKQVPC